MKKMNIGNRTVSVDDVGRVTDAEKRELNSVATEAAMDSLKGAPRLAWPPGEFFGELVKRRDAALEAMLIVPRANPDVE